MLWTDNLFGAELGNNGSIWTNRIFTRDTDGGIEFGKYPTGATTNVNSFTPWMTIINNGNVGIGTTGPTEKLHVAGGGLSTIRNEMSIWLANASVGGETDWSQNAYYSS